MNYSFTTQGNFSSPQGYNLSAQTELLNDINTTNDKQSTVIDNYSCNQKSINTNHPIGPNVGTINSMITITQEQIVNSLRVKIKLEHDRDSDLDIYLVSPDGTRVELSTDNGGTGHDYIETLFDDDSTNLITAGSAPFTGTYKPEGSLADFIGVPANGVWQLEITDDENGKSGMLQSWELDICGTTSLGVYDNTVNANDLIIKTVGDKHFVISLVNENINEKLTFKVFDIYGKELLSLPIGKQNGAYTYPLNMDKFASGVYIIRLGDANFGKVKRLLVK
jgi:subtilisin-like proprotein convertase family protein